MRKIHYRLERLELIIISQKKIIYVNNLYLSD